MGATRTPRWKGALIVGVMIAISGPPAAGKSTLARELALYFGAPRASFGDVVREVAEQQGNITPSSEELEIIGTALIDEGWDAFCNRLLRHVPDTSDLVVVDGIRHRAAVEALARKSESPPVCVFVDADAAVLRHRSRQRHATKHRSQHSEMELAALQMKEQADVQVQSPWDLRQVASEVVRVLENRR